MSAPEAAPDASAVPAEPAQGATIEAEVIYLLESKCAASRLTFTSKADDYNDADSAIAVSTIRSKRPLLIWFVGFFDELNRFNSFEYLKL
jgi:hypothetical protein